MHWKYFIFVLFCASEIWFKSASGNSNEANFFQDLTDPIDKAIIDGDDVPSTETLKAALKISSRVYYIMDKPINQILDLLPVIDLLNKCSPTGEAVSLMVSLPYTSQNRFLPARYDDLFYSLTLNVTPNSWQVLQQHVAAFIIDINTDGCTESEYFYSKPGHYSKYEPFSVSLSDNLKDFLNLIQTTTGLETRETGIPVGVAYDLSQLGCANYLRNELKNSDFDLVTLNAPFYPGVPVSSPTFKDYVEQLKRTISNKYTSEYHRRNRLGFNPKSFLYKIRLEENITPEQVMSHWNVALQSSLNSSSFFPQVTAHFLEFSYKNNLKLLQNSDSFNIQADNNANLGNVIQSRALLQPASQQSQNNTALNSTVGIIPIVSTNQLKIIWSQYCHTAFAFPTAGKETLVFNEYAWMAFGKPQNFAIFPEDRGRVFSNCRRSINNYNQDRNIILVFDSGISKTWQALERYMDVLVDQQRKVLNSTVSTIVFHEDDISFVPGSSFLSTGFEAGSGEIATFLRKWNSEFSTGCVITFNGDKINQITKAETSTEKFRDHFGKLCQPVFDIVNIFIWLVPLDNTVPMGWSAMHSDIVVTRSVFLKEFPNKQVFIQFDYPIHYNNGQRWGDFHDIPVLLKDNYY